MPHFLDLPPELRDTIYEYCLVVEGEINPYPTDYEKQELMRPFPRKPDVSLLLVSKLIRAEAEIVLYGQNLWRLSYSKAEYLMWNDATKLIRRLVVNFDVRDLDSTDRLETSLKARLTCYETHDTSVSDQCHGNLGAKLIEEIWWWKIRKISQMMLSTLALDFTNCYCPHFCCRLVEALEYGLTDPWKNPSFDPVVEIIGWIDEAEAEVITEMGFTCEGWDHEWRTRSWKPYTYEELRKFHRSFDL